MNRKMKAVASGIAAHAALALGGAACGQEEIIDVTRLPAGNARGSVASGFYDWEEWVVSSDCRESVTVGTATVRLPRIGDRWDANAYVDQQDGQFGLFLEGFGGDAAPPDVERPGYLADGGLYQGGQFRVGGIFAFGAGVQARALIDGIYTAPPPACRGIVRSFQGRGLVQVDVSEGGRLTYSCQYAIRFTGDREEDCPL